MVGIERVAGSISSISKKHLEGSLPEILMNSYQLVLVKLDEIR